MKFYLNCICRLVAKYLPNINGFEAFEGIDSIPIPEENNIGNSLPEDDNEESNIVLDDFSSPQSMKSMNSEKSSNIEPSNNSILSYQEFIWRMGLQKRHRHIVETARRRYFLLQTLFFSFNYF